MEFDYQKETKNHYKDDQTAQIYNEAFKSKKWKTLNSQIIAKREVKIISKMLGRVPHSKVLDIPVGTGKLASLLTRECSDITACDISENMLGLARVEFEKYDCDKLKLLICDAEKICESLNDHFDLAISLRLMHRVPGDVKNNILSELSSASDYAIVSFGMDSFFHSIRRLVRSAIFGGETHTLGGEPLDLIKKRIMKNFEILAKKRVLPGLSQEVIFLLRSKNSKRAR